ncbi:MAG: hypothetical protein GXP00_02330 [Alphaproteobacteria bacterium]|nr:hypothetical protein [Alphaproteobacteria bacterium]
MSKHSYPYPTAAFATKTARHAFPWSKITLLFLMTSSFLIFATTGASNSETLASWTNQVSEIITGTALFTLAAILLVWAGRLMPKNI